MFRNLTRRASIRMLAATVGVGALVALGGGAAAQASTVPAGGGHGQPVLVHVTSTPRTATKVIMATPPYPSNCAYNDATCTYDSGLTSYNDGGCQEETIATWWGAPKNVLNVTVRVVSPYWFAGCKAHATVYFGMNSGPPLAVGPFFGAACSETDPTCSADQSWTYQVNQAVPTSQYRNLNSIYTNTTT